MRRYQQQQILELLGTIKEAQEKELFADCQDGALTIGEFIESIKGEGTQTVALLEEYCDLLYKANNGEINAKTLRKHFILIENSIKTELKPDKLEVLFLPHQPSRWDSLESVYFAAEEDPDCEAFVVPVPYYELNPDESIDYNKMHYDGGSFPENIPITNYNDYDIEARHPDIIFKDYPFDDNTSTFSIHPDYYSSRLHSLCEMLVWIPYFVVVGDEAPDFYAYLPGTVYSHRVIVQSEPVRQSYIKHYNKSDKENNWNGCFGRAQDKFIALGSPKFDKVINSKPDDFQLPEPWEKLICKPDGAKKKTVLLNTHMFTWMRFGEQYFKKLRYIFEKFKTCDDIVLWWRPHPFTEINFKAMYPHLVDAYREITGMYRNEGWGIYDDSSELHRAIACTDAYFGDGGSLVALYRATGKPVILQDLNIDFETVPYAGLLQNIIPDNLHDCGEYYIFSATRVNGLFKLDKETRKCEYLGTFPGEKITGGFLFACTAQVGSKVYFSPRLTKSIGVYDTDSGKIEAIPFPVRELPEGSEKIPFYFGRIFAHGKNIYLIPSFYPGVPVYNTATGEFTNIDDWLGPLQEYIFDRQRGYFSCGYIDTENDRLLLPGRNANVLVEIDLTSHTSKIYKLGDDKAGYVDILPDGDGYWLLDACKKGISYCSASFEPGLNKTEQLGADSYVTKLYQYKHDKQQSGERPLFSRLTRVDDTIYLMPIWTEEILSFDVKSKQFSVAHDFARDNAVQGIENWFGYFSGFTKSSDYTDIRIHVTSGRDGGNLIEYNLETGEVRDENLCVTDEASMKRFKEDLIQNFPLLNSDEKNNYYAENPLTLLDLKRTVSFAIDKRNEAANNKTGIPENGNAGKTIYEYCRKLLL